MDFFRLSFKSEPSEGKFYFEWQPTNAKWLELRLMGQISLLCEGLSWIVSGSMMSSLLHFISPGSGGLVEPMSRLVVETQDVVASKT
jgi:hypothetical protein